LSSPFVLFEVSWEVCNKVGGIHTVISTKAKTATKKFGDAYIAVGPWLLSESDREVPFDDEPGHKEFCETCRSHGIPVRVGHWLIPGSPRTILVEFSQLYEGRDDILSGLWEKYHVDSISGGWDYVEPVLFGHAAGMVIELWWEEYLATKHGRAIVHAHEWMTGSTLLYLKSRLPSLGTVFTTHATMLGRALSSLGQSPSDGLGDKTARDLADENGVTAKHSLEGVSAREADVFTTVSEITAAEAELLHERRPDPVLPNGIDLEVIDEIAGDATPDSVRATLIDVASRFVGEDVSDATLLAISGRYEFHNKGIDLLLDALAGLESREGGRVVLFVLVPAGNSGIRSEVLERRSMPLDEIDGPVGIATHNLFDEDRDPVREACLRLGLDNEPGSRVKVVHVPTYLDPRDGLFNQPYEAVLRAMDLSCFPSYYEPWGYTPQESLAVGVPTITSDYAGFGCWAKGENLDATRGLTVLPRVHREYDQVVDDLVGTLERFLSASLGEPPRVEARTCRDTAQLTAWAGLFANYEQAYANALDKIRLRARAGTPPARRPKRPVTVLSTPHGSPRLTHFDVAPSLPAALQGLSRLAHNYWWSWDAEATDLFAELDPDGWVRCDHNPVALLEQADAEHLEARANDADYCARLQSSLARFETYLTEDRQPEWLTKARDEDGDTVPSAAHPIAYFSAEFGIHESLRIYSGGLGVLAGDHLKSASDLGLPLVGIGLFYRMGYMRQQLMASGEQTAVDQENDTRQLALEPVKTAEGAPLEIQIQLPGRTLHVRAWRVRVGIVSLYLLDTNTPSNLDEDRDITRNLYGGDEKIRIQQEIVLGRGGARLLRTLGIHPSVFHMNEGHAAFLTLERVSRLVGEEGLTFDAARELVSATTMFTTHTPVPAGHDRFSEDLVRRYFSDAEEWVGVPWDRFFDLGRTEEGEFNMTYLAMSFASKVNAVSRLHAIASRKLLKSFWPGLLEEEVPVSPVTNGVHLPSWIHPEIVREVGGDTDRPINGTELSRLAKKVRPEKLWKAKRTLKLELIERARDSIEKSFVSRNDSPLTLHRILAGLDPDAMLIGFARRFAPYKRAHLLFADIDRLSKLLSDAERPVRVLIAGKAHPRDQYGLDILRSIAERTRNPELIGKVMFLENYDIGLARNLVRGVDVWLNNPTRMLEASGTSGMKAAGNGTLNLSIGDGWWPEAHDGENGWTIAGERVYADQELQDQFDAAALYRLLEEEIVPMYFDRDRNGMPKAWTKRMAMALATIPIQFNTDRMVGDYFHQGYRPLAKSYFECIVDGKARPKELARNTLRIRQGFGAVKVVDAHVADLNDIKVGESIGVRIGVDLGSLTPDDVQVEFVVGSADGDTLRNAVAVPLVPMVDDKQNGTVRFEGAYRVEGAGRYGHGLRVRARRGGDTGGVLKDLVFWV